MTSTFVRPLLAAVIIAGAVFTSFSAEARSHHRHWHARHNLTYGQRHHRHWGRNGRATYPITAGDPKIRINGVGEVITSRHP